MTTNVIARYLQTSSMSIPQLHLYLPPPGLSAPIHMRRSRGDTKCLNPHHRLWGSGHIPLATKPTTEQAKRQTSHRAQPKPISPRQADQPYARQDEDGASSHGVSVFRSPARAIEDEKTSPQTSPPPPRRSLRNGPTINDEDGVSGDRVLSPAYVLGPIPSSNESPSPSTCHDEDKAAAAMPCSSLRSSAAMSHSSHLRRTPIPSGPADLSAASLQFHNALPPSTCHDEDGASVLPLLCTPHSSTAVPPPHSSSPYARERKKRGNKDANPP
ncbi:hypothetical protein R3P38DRAFT_3547487 [Favolaschia claudopus]|uniref:Uncharacterized protein n=1 Tax=Favolaschia claudopus TaxID=2862362 RepID=A0AAW0E2W0_9AGAR